MALVPFNCSFSVTRSNGAGAAGAGAEAAGGATAFGADAVGAAAFGAGVFVAGVAAPREGLDVVVPAGAAVAPLGAAGAALGAAVVPLGAGVFALDVGVVPLGVGVVPLDAGLEALAGSAGVGCTGFVAVCGAAGCSATPCGGAVSGRDDRPAQPANGSDSTTTAEPTCLSRIFIRRLMSVQFAYRPMQVRLLRWIWPCSLQQSCGRLLRWSPAWPSECGRRLRRASFSEMLARRFIGAVV